MYNDMMGQGWNASLLTRATLLSYLKILLLLKGHISRNVLYEKMIQFFLHMEGKIT